MPDHSNEQVVKLIVTLRDTNDDRQFDIVLEQKVASPSAWGICSDLAEITEASTELLLAQERDEDGSLKAAAEAGDIVPDMIRRSDPTREIAVAGRYPFHEDRYEEIFQAVDEDDAGIQGLFSMAHNHFNDRLGFTNTSMMEEFVHYMMDCFLEVVSTTEAKFNQSFIELVKAVRSDGDIAGALAQAEEVLKLRGMLDIEPSSGMAP